MKYLFAIVGIVLCSMALSVFFSYHSKPVSTDAPVLMVNDKRISVKEFQDSGIGRVNENEPTGEYIESLVTRELLIQEAKRLGIDKDEEFRKSIQRYYEQSLVKLLLDRQYDNLDISVSGEELAWYTQLRQSDVRFSLHLYKTLENTRNGTVDEKEDHQGPYLEFGDFIRQQLFSLKPGESSSPERVGDLYQIVVFHEAIHSDKSDQAVDVENLREELMELKKEQKINVWLQELRARADVKIIEQPAVNPGS